MSLILPDWVTHQDEKKKRTTIFSVHVHPDGSRLATAGLDTKIRIWATEPILHEEVAQMEGAHKLLSTLARHTGSVLCVRWSHSGRFLASGSDDTVALIWDLDPSGMGGLSFGSTETNVEQWRPHRRLPGHESDVTDLAWSEEDEYIATVGLDSLVFIWSGTTFEKIRKIDGHQGFVKGVVWDPIGQFIATASDDKTVKVWRTTDWGLETQITEPFAASPSSTFFRRLSWSPDGAHLLTANAMNGPVFVASVAKRTEWTSDISLVGHENSVVVTAFNPCIFRPRGADPDAAGSIATVLALGSLDQSVSIWMTGNSRPILVARDVFDRQVMDLSWSADGLILYACSSDGTIAVFSFTNEQLADYAPAHELREARSVYGFKKPAPQLAARSATPLTGTTERPNVLQVRKASRPAAPANGMFSGAVNGATNGIRPANARPGAVTRLDQQITITKDGKRRIKPTLLDSGSSSPAPEAIGSYGALPAPASHRLGSSAASPRGAMVPPNVPAIAQRSMAYASMDFADSSLDGGYDTSMDMLGSTAGDMSFSGDRYGAGPSRQSPELDAASGTKRKATAMSDDAEPLRVGQRVKGRDVGRTLGGDAAREALGPQVQLRSQVPPTVHAIGACVPPGLPPPSLLSHFRREEAGGLVEVRNFDDGRPSEIALLETSANEKEKERVLWLDFAPSPALLATASTHFVAVAFEDATVVIYSTKGRRLTTLVLGDPCFRLESSKHVLMAITTSGMLQRWDIKSGKEMHRPISVLRALGSADNLLKIWVHTNGAPVLLLRNEMAYTLDTKKLSLVPLSGGWWADSSPCWEGRIRGRGSIGGDSGNGIGSGIGRREPVRVIESEINNLVVARSSTGIRPSARPAPERLAEFETAAALRHLEMRMNAAVLLDSPTEYKQFLQQYARKLAEEGIRNQAEDLIRCLLGPIYFKPTDQEEWEPTVLGFEKRALLQTVLQIMGKSRLLVNLVQTYQETLRNMLL